jgi:sterol desaturase/sphingolipid hydroxylase (fatty acid hydroxylase superfamily)
MHYDVGAGLALLAAAMALIGLRHAATRLVPALARAEAANRAEAARKLATPRHPPVVRASTRTGHLGALLFFGVVGPLVATLAAQPWTRGVRDVVLIVLAYDLVYYVVHRWAFHGPLLLRVHALHHRIRDPCAIDVLYVHPAEALISIGLFAASVAALALALGRLHVVTVAVGFLLFSQVNVLNHTRLELPGRRWAVVGWISAKHALHHRSMRAGNFGTLTLLYDALFGTLE